MSPTVPWELLCDPVWAYMYSIYRVYCSLHVHQCPKQKPLLCAGTPLHSKVTLWFSPASIVHLSVAGICGTSRLALAHSAQPFGSRLQPSLLGLPPTPIDAAHSVTVSSFRTSAGLSTSTWRMSDREMMPSMLERSSTTTKR